MSLPDPPPITLKKEQEEKEQKRKEKVEDHLYTIIKVARDEDLGEQIGKEIYFDLVDHDKVRTFRIQKQMPFTQLKEEVAKELGIPVQFQRYWIWAKRQNHTYRPDRALTAHEETQSVGQLRDRNSAELKLFLDVELCLDLRPFPPPEKTKEDILLFFKFYDPLKEKIRYVGRLFVKESGKPMEILTKLNELVGFSPDEEIELFEEIKFEPNVMCEHIDGNQSFRDCEIGDGDIICFQKSLRNHVSEQYRFPEVPSFLEYVHNRQPEEHQMVVPISDSPTKIPQTIKVAPADTASTVDAQAVDDPASAQFTWTIDNFSRLNVKKLYSEVFNVGGYKWRILIFPKGNKVDCLSIYLDVADSASLPYGWSKYAQFSLAVHNQIQNKFTVRKDTQHQFNEREKDWGFTSFMLLSDLCHPEKGYIMDDTVIIEADVAVRKAN
ncbi:ubiquitin C-terminal hydrolase 12 isoform X1 [Nicotiana tabacum]|uniref:Ubiquitin C-terminal hydrolase 12 isoform X1 n=2 Tax=Nicotiana tabacum TaxID=4097 RepID=A0A1S4BCC9_TOBAC